jgi:hypothetical protein
MKTLIRLSTTVIFLFGTVHCAKTSNSSADTSTAGTTCSTGYLYSTYYGCQLQCGTSSVWYNGQCIATTTSVTGTASTTCSSGYLYSTAYGCQPQCGTSMIWYNNACIAATTTTTTTTVSTANVCQSFCPSGYVAVGSSCLPQATCGSCYGYSGGYCYVGNGASAFYGTY